MPSLGYKDVQGFKFESRLLGVTLSVYVYFIDGLLIDTGHPNGRKQIFATLKGLPVNQIFLTHYHEDHSGNSPLFQEHFQCPAYSSSLCAEIMKNPPPLCPAQKILWGDRPANSSLIPEDHLIQTPNYTFQLIPVPGHAPDMFALYEANHGLIFSADLWISPRINYFIDSESMKDQIESLKRLLTLDFDALLCSHNPVLKDGKTAIRKKLQFLEDFYGRVATLYHKGYSVWAIRRKIRLKEHWLMYALSLGALSATNMIRSVIRDEQAGS